MKKLIVITLGLIVITSAQTARVSILTPADAKDAFDTYHAMKDAEKRWESVQAKLKRSYGIENDFEFSADFKVIVQKEYSTTGSALIGPSGVPRCGTAEANKSPSSTCWSW